MKANEPCRIIVVAAVAICCIVAPISAQSQDHDPRTISAQPNGRQFVLDQLDRKMQADSNYGWVIARLIAEKLDTNRAFQAFLINEPRRVFDTLPVKPFRSSDSPLVWNQAMVEIRRIGTSGAEMGVRVSSKDGADDLMLITVGGTNHHFARIENLNFSCSLDDTPDRAQEQEWLRSPMPRAAAEEMVTNLFWQLVVHYGYNPSELLPVAVSTTNQFLVARNSDSAKENRQTIRSPCWTATFHCRTNRTVQGAGETSSAPEPIGFFSFAFHQSSKTWMPLVVDLYACPRTETRRPLVELADAFLEANWAETIYETFTANPSNVVRQVTARYHENPYLSRTLQGQRQSN